MVMPTGLETLGDKSLQAVPAVVFHFPCSILTKYVPKSGGCSSLLLLADKVSMFTTSLLLAGGGAVWYLGFRVFLQSFACIWLLSGISCQTPVIPSSARKTTHPVFREVRW